MTRLLCSACLALALAPAPPEPAPRTPTLVPLHIDARLTHVSAARELADGRVILSDAKTPAVFVLDPATGALTRLGSPGAGLDQYIQPGGLYGGPDGSTLLLDRAQMRVMVISPAGVFTRTFSIAEKGVTSSSSADIDLQRLDARGLSYFQDRWAHDMRTPAAAMTSLPLIRFHPVTQQRETVAELRQPESKSVDLGNGMVIGQSVIGAPADGFGIVPDGRIAVVRAEPYRVDWVAPDGHITRGVEIVHDPVPMTDTDREIFKAAKNNRPSVGLQSAGSRSGVADMEPVFAATKAPFSPDDVAVSPAAQVWVMRSRPAAETAVTYDVFDDRGRRIDRLQFPAGSRVIGFGSSSVYVRETDGSGRIALRKYKV